MDYNKMKALMHTCREQSSAQRNHEVKEFPKPDSKPDWKYLDYVAKERIAAQEVAVMRTPTIFQWYRILRQHYQFTVFQATRGALWLVR